MDVTPEKDKVDWENLQDNRDVQVILSWDPPMRLVCRIKFTQIYGKNFFF
jgi:hypothetical protein